VTKKKVRADMSDGADTLSGAPAPAQALTLDWVQKEYGVEGRRGGIVLFVMTWRIVSTDPYWKMVCTLPGLSQRGRAWKDDDQSILRKHAGVMLRAYLDKIENDRT
jgi:hypothetical protein